MSELKIDTDVPLPQPRAKLGKWKSVAAEMRIGHSVKVGTENERDCIRTALKAIGLNATSRREGDGYRVWALKAE